VPVAYLYCEGSFEGTDIRVISQIAPRGCVVRPVGSKNRLAEAVIADRRRIPSLAGLVDRDFDCVQKTNNQQPIELFEGTIQVGWSWERKEIENYLLDPCVIEQTCIPKYGFTLDEYQEALQKVVERLKFYTAARTALSCSEFKDRWGSAINNVFSARYSFPSNLERQACQTKIKEIVDQSRGDRIITSANVIEKFEELVSQFSTLGYRTSHPLVYHSGKDLLLAMKPHLDSWLPNPQNSIQTFTEQILKQLERSDKTWTWLPEWAALRELLENTEFLRNIA
jgi:hypothetical protein